MRDFYNVDDGFPPERSDGIKLTSLGVGECYGEAQGILDSWGGTEAFGNK
jgi:hypothetical protein